MRNILFAAAFVPFVCHAQISGFKATTSGDLFFQTSAQPPSEYQLPQRLRLYISHQGVVRPFPLTESINGFDVSADGGVIALNTGQQAIIVNADGYEWMRLDGTARLSRNGRYAAVEFQQHLSLIDVDQRRVLATFPGLSLAKGHVIANNGTCIAIDSERLPVLIRSGVAQPFAFAPLASYWPLATFFLEESGRSVAVAYGSMVYIRTLASTVTSSLQLQSTSYNPIVHYDGLSVLFIDGSAVRRQRFDGAPAEAIFNAPSNIVEAVMAGTAGFYFTTGIGLYEYQSASRAIRHIVSAASLTSAGFALGPTAQGAIATWVLSTPLQIPDFTGSAPYPEQWSGYRVLLNGIAVPIVSIDRVRLSNVSYMRIQFLVPWNVPVLDDLTPARLSLDSVEGIFLSITTPPTLYLRRYNPVFESVRAISPITLQPFIRTSQPAQPGSPLTLHMRGLGRVIGEPPNNRPPSTVMTIATPLECTVSNGIEAHKVPIESAALSLTEFAVYDVRITLPTLASQGEYFIGCEMGELGASGSIPVRRLE